MTDRLRHPAAGGRAPRRWRPGRLAVGAALLATSLMLAVLPGRADAAELVLSGWWWRAQTGVAVPVPNPPQVPEGGFMVAGEPSGATAMAALRFELEEGETSPILTLRVAEGGDQGGETAIMAACVAGSPWVGTGDRSGRWEDHPAAACDEASVSGVRSEDGSSWTFALTPLLVDGLLDLVIVPGTVPEAPPGANGSTFQLAFEAVTDSDLETSSGTAPGEASFDVPSLSEFGADFGEDFAGGASGDASFSPPSFSPPGQAAFTPALPEDEQGLGATAPSVRRRNPVLELTPAASDDGADTRLLGIVVMALAGVIAVGTAREPLPPPRRLGRLASRPGPAPAAGGPATAPAMGGLGRFARPRTGAVPRL